MATVNKSDKTYNVIISNINEMFKKRREDALDWGVPEEELAAKILQFFVPAETLEKLQSVPNIEDFVEKSSHFVFYFTEIDGAPSRQHRFRLPKPEFVPHKLSNWASDVKLPRNEVTKEIYSIFDRRNEQIAAVENAKNAFKETFSKMWHSVNSVNKLIKVWPAAWELLDDDIRTRLKRKTASSNASSEIDEEEIKKLNAAFIAAKVAQ